MAKPKIKASDIRDIAKTGTIIVTPGKHTLDIAVGAVTIFASQDETHRLIQTLNHYAAMTWGEEWQGYKKGRSTTQERSVGT